MEAVSDKVNLFAYAIGAFHVDVSDAHGEERVKRVLVMDDDRNMRDIIRLFLEKAGYEVLEAADGAEGLRLCSDGSVDLAIVDIFMPEKDGLEVMGELRNRAVGTPVLAISGGGSSQMPEMLNHATAFGAKDILPKPFSEGELVAAVERLVGGA